MTSPVALRALSIRLKAVCGGAPTPSFSSGGCVRTFAAAFPFSSRTFAPIGWVAGPHVVQRRGVADEKAVKNRMRSVHSIQKITKAMKMVAASKLRTDQARREAGLPFCTPVLNLFGRLCADSAGSVKEGSTTSPLRRSAGPNLLLAISSDKGLCGGVNAAIAKLTKTTLTAEDGSGKNTQVYGVGDKIRASLQRLFADRMSRLFNEIMKVPLNFTVAAVIADRLLLEAKKEDTQLAILHNAFQSVIAYKTSRMDLVSFSHVSTKRENLFDSFEFEPELTAMLQDLYEFYVAAAVYKCLLENAVSEQSARMAAMDNASKNAGEVLQQLTLKYNNARQMKITMELIEIISGANAL